MRTAPAGCKDRAEEPAPGKSRPLRQRQMDEALLGETVDGKGLRLPLAEDGVLGCLRNAELDHALGRNLDGFSSLRIAAHARLPVCQDQLANTWNHKGILRF